MSHLRGAMNKQYWRAGVSACHYSQMQLDAPKAANCQIYRASCWSQSIFFRLLVGTNAH